VRESDVGLEQVENRQEIKGMEQVGRRNVMEYTLYWRVSMARKEKFIHNKNKK